MKNKKVCQGCETEYSMSNYYTTKSVFFPDKKLHICKKCVNKIIEEDSSEFVRFLQLIDKPLLRDDYGKASSNGEYIKNLQSLPQYRDMRFTDSDSLQVTRALDEAKSVDVEDFTILTDTEIEESVYLWGKNRKEEDYIWLNNTLGLYLEENPRIESDQSLQDHVIDLCIARLQKRKLEEEGKATKEVSAQIKSIYDSAGMQPKQKSKIGENGASLGTIIANYEKKKHLEPAKKWKDKDELSEEIQTWFLGGVSNMMGKAQLNPFHKKFKKAVEKWGWSPDREDD